MRLVSLALACALVGVTSIEARGAAMDPTTRVRSVDAFGQRLLNIGFARSPTFRRLVTRLQRSDVIVYVKVRHDMPARLGGALRFITRTATDRFLLVSINAKNSQPMLVALLGHELQHAVEVADAPDVASPSALSDLYRRIGVHMAVDSWDSRAAQEAGQLVRTEYLRAPDETRMARHASARDDELLAGGSITAAR
jgi:hypothetical protein